MPEFTGDGREMLPGGKPVPFAKIDKSAKAIEEIWSWCSGLVATCRGEFELLQLDARGGDFSSAINRLEFIVRRATQTVREVRAIASRA